MTTAKTTVDKASGDYWDSPWQGQEIPNAVDLRTPGRWKRA